MANVAESNSRLRAFIQKEALAAGFDVIAFTSPDAAPHAPQGLTEYLAVGHHGSMVWMEETAERRSRPASLWPEVRSIIMLGMNYGPDENPLALLERKDRGVISVYARNRDYHDLIKGKLKMLASKLASRTAADVKVFVDTAPVMEKPLAAAAGLGWQGKHTNLVSREFGSWLLLGSIFTTADIPPDVPEVDRCGSCTACMAACPTQAFPAPHKIDARRCISYLTIENKEPIPFEFRKAMGNRIYGCDDCLAACPWNKFAQTASEMKLRAREDLRAPALADFLVMDDAAFRQFFSGSPVKRIGRNRFLRNVLIAAGNSGDPSFVPACMTLLDDEAAQVRGAAIWAVSQLLSRQDFMRLFSARAAEEADPAVLREWDEAAKSA